MAQRLIVEGNDAIALSELLIKRSVKPPKGYSTKEKYKEEFVKRANSISKVNKVLMEELQSTDVTNIGIIVDANDVGVEARLDSLKGAIEKVLNLSFPRDAALTENGFGCQLMDNLYIGIWIMPDNINEGYLEHFLGKLIPKKTQTIWKFADEKIEELIQQKHVLFSAPKRQKALLHTYLAWQKKPGESMGTAVRASYFDVSLPAADNFVKWFENTFELEP